MSCGSICARRRCDWLPAIQLDGVVGDKIDYAGARLGKGATLNLSGTLRMTDHLELQAADVARVARSRFGPPVQRADRLAESDVHVLAAIARPRDRRSGRRSSATATTDRKVTLSGLYAYKLNWQTVFFVGYGDAEDARSVFMKVAYAFQRVNASAEA